MGQSWNEPRALERRAVLVVDDEPSLRVLAADLFEVVGCEAIQARDGAEALDVLEQRPDVALLFTDCQMPRMSGPDLARAASERWPNLRIVLVTGFQDRLMPEWPMVWKPYSGRTIVRLVDQMLAPALAGARHVRPSSISVDALG